jgi:type II secretory pathway pseudopilin PulG
MRTVINNYIFNKHTSGFSLIEVLMGIGLLGLAAMANLALSQMVNDHRRVETTRFAYDGLNSALAREFSSTEVCDEVLKGKAVNLQSMQTVTGSEILPINLPSGLILAQNEDLPLYGFKPTSMVLNNAVQVNPNWYVTNISAKFDSMRVAGNRPMPAMSLGAVYINIDTNSRIAECRSITPPGDSNTCLTLGCQYVQGSCRCPMRSFQCPPGEMLVEIINGVPFCLPLGNGGSCPFGTLMTGLGIGTMTCEALPTPPLAPVVAGQCGAATALNNLAALNSAGAAALCSAGTPSTTTFSGAGPTWTWTCLGSGVGGTDSNCSTTQSGLPVNPGCSLAGQTAVNDLYAQYEASSPILQSLTVCAGEYVTNSNGKCCARIRYTGFAIASCITYGTCGALGIDPFQPATACTGAPFEICEP